MSPRRGVRAGSSRPRTRRGFTLVELMVAMSILAVGVLGLAATAATVAKLVGGAKQQTLAAAAAQSRLERLRAVPCAARAGGTDTSRGVIVAWTVDTVRRAVKVGVAVSFETTRGRRTRLYRSTMPC